MGIELSKGIVHHHHQIINPLCPHEGQVRIGRDLIEDEMIEETSGGVLLSQLSNRPLGFWPTCNESLYQLKEQDST